MSAATKLDIEHVAVHDDPRQWSSARKVCCSTRIIVHHLYCWCRLQRCSSCRPRPSSPQLLRAYTIVSLRHRRRILQHVCNLAHFNAASIVQIEHDLHATASQISWTLSLFVLIQGVVPLLWSVLSELKGRKVGLCHCVAKQRSSDIMTHIVRWQIVYIVSILLFVGGSIGAALSPSIGLLIGMRCVQAAG